MIRVDAKQLEKAENVLSQIPGAVPKAVARAINRATQNARTNAVKKITNEYTIKRKRVVDTMDIKKASPGKLSAFVLSKGSVIALSYFKTFPGKVPTRRLKNPVFVQVKKSGGGTIKGAFLAEMKSGHIGVFHRANGNSSMPIQQNYGPSVPQMLESKSVSAFIKEKAQEVLETRLEHEIDVLLRGVIK